MMISNPRLNLQYLEMYKDVLSKGPDVLGLCKDVGREKAPGEDSVDARFISCDQANVFRTYAEFSYKYTRAQTCQLHVEWPPGR